MKKREFLRTGTVLTVGAMVAPLAACGGENGQSGQGQARQMAAKEFTLPDLPYAFSALEPAIDAQTMEIHHDRHHAGYVRKLNAALDGHALAGKGLEDIMAGVTTDAADTGVRNNGGGHFNHSLFWTIMTPGGGQAPSGKLADAINSSFGSYDAFKEQFSQAAATRFGSGWAWLSIGSNGQLFVSSTPNQDNPMMAQVVDQPGTPILGIDVWEHAYYLKYQNRRGDYISNFMGIINWEAVEANYSAT